MNRRHILILLVFSLAIKAIYLLFSIAVDGNEKPLYKQYINIVKKNDAYWYKGIASKGYPRVYTKRDLGYSEGADFKQSAWAFFPFYPALNAFTVKITGLNYDLSALIWSIFFSAFSILGFYWLANDFYKDESMALFSALMMFSFPFSFYYSMFYTEALYLTFTVYSFLAISNKRLIVLSILLIPLTLVRPNGVIILVPLYIYFLEQNGVLEKFKPNWKLLFGRRNLTQSVAFISSPLAFLCYGLYQFEMTGYFFAFSIAQDGWYREFMFPILSFFRRGDLATQFNSIFTIVVIIYAFWNRKKLPFSYNFLVLISLLLPLCSGSVTSMSRFVSVIFPIFIILSAFIYKSKYKYVWFSFVLMLQIFTFYSWLINHSISY